MQKMLSLAFVAASTLAFNNIALAQSGAAEGCPENSASKSFSERFSTTYSDYLKWNGDPADAAPSWRKDVQAPPVSSPPYPFATWPIGGSETIGYDNQYYGPLMDTIYCGPNGKAWKDSRITVYGWIAPSYNISTSKSKFNFTTGTGGNYPAAYDYAANSFQLNQVAVYVERVPDVVQKDHNDWGFRVTGLYGTDYKYTFSKGVFSDQYTDKGRKYGFDPVMMYGEWYTPFVADGMNVRVGRYISVPDIEAQLAPNNYTFTHSLLYAVDPYTQQGIVATVKLNKNWLIQGEVSAGNDIAIWNKAERQFTPAACLGWTSDTANDNFYACLNGAHPILGNNGKFGWNNLQHEVVTWYHKFNENWHMSSEYWRMFQNDTPNVNDVTGAGPALLAARYGNLKYGAPSGAQCGPNDGATCKSHEWAFVNYIGYQVSPRDSVTFRTDVLDDTTGQRTGFKTRYYEFGLGWQHWIGKAITIRPELRYERSTDIDAYDNPTATAGAGKFNQTMFAIDAVIHF
ncbi:outer membrane beta-barrel protein [Undibacterium sp. RTI2.1]|uniref:outer membrane beta-barrel protein n=1 Tax=unclassified Undibacterium TaxID=2630295 RepID=UPI002B23D7EC|nr:MULTISPECIES: outer membrane beta-barrel protein [unclassified Undibacterium]MEB0033219.1 outer membrane beta-barrel protein [Undibacterium sp. RTI2.1]MEB0118584.1 outer membrane beta-barrel protein [Undibacterium sp. RTI2.2]